MERIIVSDQFDKGFTLIELLITVAVLAILATIAYPSYMDSVRRGNRSAVQSLMMEMASRQEQYLLDNRSYASTKEDLYGGGSFSYPSEVNGKYTITITNVSNSPPKYTITATPAPGSVQASDVVLTLDNLGSKTPSDKWK